MESFSSPPNPKIHHNCAFYYFTSITPIAFILIACITFYHKKNFIPYFEEIGNNFPERQLIEIGFNVCAWIMLVTLLLTDGGIRIRNQYLKSILKKDKNTKNNLQYSIGRLLTCIFGALSFVSCITYGSILICDSLKYHYIFGSTFLISTSLYFSFVNLMFIIVKMSPKKEIGINDKSNISFIDWIHAFIGPIFFTLSYLLKNRYIFISDENVTRIASISLQYIGITLLFLNFIRILFRMPVISIFLAHRKNE